MPLGEKQIRYLAALARLQLTPSEIDSLSDELTSVIGYFDRIKAVDTTDVPSYGMSQRGNTGGAEVRAGRSGRDDTVAESLPRDEALRNAPKTDGEFFIVPKVIG